MKKIKDQLWCAAGSPAVWTADYLIALSGVYVWALYAFGAFDVHRILAIAFSTSLILTLCIEMAFFHMIRIRKLLGAAINGFLIGFLMPSEVPFWAIVLVVSVVTIPFHLPVISDYVKRYIHPIALAMVFMAFVLPHLKASNTTTLIGVSSSMTPLEALLGGYMPTEGIYDLLIGRHGGLIGEISVMMIAAGGIYLIARKTIRIYAPIFMLGSLAILSYVFPVYGSRIDFLVAQLFTGGVFFTAVFLLPYFPICPSTRNGCIVYGLICGVLTYILRRFAPTLDGVYLALLIAGAVTAFIEPLLAPHIILWKKDY